MRHLFIVAFSLWCAVADFAHGAETAAALRERAQAVLAQLDGELVIPGLTAPVEVLRDRWGVPHIYAQNDADLFFAQGFVVAQDRLFQLDIWRRVGIGETAAVVGEKGLAGDRFARLMKYRGDWDREWQSYSPDAKAIATAFTAGINAAIDQMGDKLPIEFQILGFRPARWKPEDILGRMSGLIMCGNYDDEIDRAALIKAIGLTAARIIVPTDPVRDFAPVPELSLDGFNADEILAGYNAATAPLPYQLSKAVEPDRGGSNNWAVTGRRSASGKPLLAGDPHRALLLPSLRYLVHLNAPGWNVIGAGEPALPGVAIGHNERVAWAFTIVNTDQCDLYVEETKPDDPTQYKVGDRWESMEIVREKVAVRNHSAPAELELRYTRHGAVIHQDEKRHKAYVLRWVGSEPGAAAYLASLRLDRVKDTKEFTAQLANWKVPALNMVFADVAGDIGWVASGATPVRGGWDGLLPVPGAAGKYEWQRFLAVDELPQKHNPADGYVASANYNILPPNYPHTISYEWSTPYRIRQIERRLGAKDVFTVDDFRSIQHDSTSIPGQELVGLLQTFDTKSLDAECVALMRKWDGVLSKDSRAAVLYAYWIAELQRNFYQMFVPRNLLSFARTRGGVQTMLKALRTPSLLDTSDSLTSRQEFLETTFAEAVKETKQRFPNFPIEGTWGELHAAEFTHPLAKLGPAYAEAFNLKRVPKAGDGYTPNAATYDGSFRQTNGATYREIFDLADWDRGLATTAPGQSGQPGSPYYDNWNAPWGDEEYFPLAFSRAKVDEVTAHRLILRPALSK